LIADILPCYHFASTKEFYENMPNVLVRDVEPEILEKIKKRAAKNGRSLQTEVQIILKDAAAKPEPLSDLETARKIRSMLNVKNQSDSAELLREDRQQ
jgi:plasmid stability protein